MRQIITNFYRSPELRSQIANLISIEKYSDVILVEADPDSRSKPRLYVVVLVVKISNNFGGLKIAKMALSCAQRHGISIKK